MSPETARWLLEGVKAFSKDPNLSEWNLLPRDYFLFILNQTLETKTFLEAREILEKIILEELTAPNIPSELEFWHQELEEAEEQKREIRKETLERVRAQIRTWQTQAKPILPLAGRAKPGISLTEPPPPPKETDSLPPEITEKLAAEDEGVALAPIFTLLQPKVATSFIKKAVLAAPVKTLQFLDKIAGGELTGEATPEWREILHQGLTSKDLEASVLAYQEAGISPEHPVVKNLEAKRTRVKAYEQNHRFISGILRHYHQFSKITGRRQIFLPEVRSFLPRLAQAPAWAKKQGYSWGIRQGLNRLGFVFRTHEKIALGPGKTVVKFTLPDKFGLGVARSFIYRKTLGATLKWFGKTTLGKGIKKGAAWILTRLGLAAIPTGVTQAMAAALLVKDVLTIAPKFLKWFFKKLWDNPLLAGFLGAGFLLLALLLALPVILVVLLVAMGTILLVSALLAGAAQLGGAIISGVGSFLGGVGNVVGGIFSSLGTISLPSGISWAPIVAPASVGILGVMTFINTSSAFIEKPTTAVGVPTPYGACSLASNTPGSGALKELMINASQWAGIPPAVLAGVASIEGGHLFGYSDQQIQQFSAPGAQDPTNCAPNGCGARGPMQFLNDGVATDCGQYTGRVMPDVWGAYKGAVNQAIPGEQRDPNVCNIKDSLYAAAWKIKGDSQTPADQTCVWDEQTVNRVGLAYYGECTTSFPRLGNKTYCQYLWDYYKTYNLVQTPSPSGWFFWQADHRWRDYQGSLACNVGSHGCGPTSMAMVFKAFGSETTPPLMWDRFVDHGYLICGIGSDWTAMRTIPPQAGLSSEDLGVNWERASQKLQEGKLVIAATNLYGGHILVVRKIEGDLVITNDPAVSNGDGKPYTRAGLLLRNFWAVGK